MIARIDSTQALRAFQRRMKDAVVRPLAAGDLAGARAAAAFIGALRRTIAGTGPISVRMTLTEGRAKSGKAIGGPVQAGVPYLINERTPRSEVMVPSTGGHILTRAQATAALRGAGGPTYNITVNPGSDVSSLAARRFGRLVADEMATTLREQRARTGTVMGGF